MIVFSFVENCVTSFARSILQNKYLWRYNAAYHDTLHFSTLYYWQSFNCPYQQTLRTSRWY